MVKPKLLDLFCGAGGASVGYHLAGFDVTGVDLRHQPRYPFEFIRGDALDYVKEHGHEYDALAGSPPCHDHSALSTVAGKDGTGWLLDATRQAFIASGKPYVIENVPGAAMNYPLQLCGTEFDLCTTGPRGPIWLRRHRLFESNLFLMAAGGCSCFGRNIIGVYGHGDGGGRTAGKGWKGTFAMRKAVMGIDWMNREELAQAIPPAYTRFIGDQLMNGIKSERTP